MATPNSAELRVIDLGRLAYAPALEIQRQTHQAVLENLSPQTLILVEHEPVITVSQRGTAAKNLVASPAALARLGIDVQPTDRGGDITYHGPGQLVAYPILRLASLGLNVGRYMRFLEDVVIQMVATFGVQAVRDPGATGVWVAEPPLPLPGGRVRGLSATVAPPELANPLAPALPRKLCAMGVRVRRNITMHGLALNVTTQLDHFATIIPCGLAGRGVTSLEQLLGPAAPSMDVVKTHLVDVMRQRVAELTSQARSA